MRYGAALAVLMALWSTASCSSSPTAPSDAQNRFTWTDGTESFPASENGMTALRGGNSIFLTGLNCSGRRGFNLTIAGSATVGSYAIGHPALSYVGYNDGTAEWAAGEFFGGSGSLTISSVDQARIAGTFSFEMIIPGQRETGPRKSVQGMFDLGFADRTIC